MRVIKDGLTFNDLLIIPDYSTITSRKNVDVSINILGRKFSLPFVPANMKTVAGFAMCEYFVSKKSLAICHRFWDNPLEKQLSIFNKLNKPSDYFSVSVGVKNSDKEFVVKAYDEGVRIFTIDIAHLDSKLGLEMCNYIAKLNNILLIAGNVATGQSARRVWDSGANVVKCGIGSGSICTTRITTSCGYPQMSALFDIQDNKHSPSEYICSDGGIQNIGHVGLALSVADFVMMGSYFAGTDETPSEIFEHSGVKYCKYEGSSTYKSNNIEGIKSWVKYKGPVSKKIQHLIEGIQSTCSYVGANNLNELKENVRYVKMTNATLVESGNHSIDKIIH